MTISLPDIFFLFYFCIRDVHSSHFQLIFNLIFRSFSCIWQGNKQKGMKNDVKIVTMNTLGSEIKKNEVKMHFSHQAHCQKGEK